jgi:membrane associated rhomboid family serine protease
LALAGYITEQIYGSLQFLAIFFISGAITDILLIGCLPSGVMLFGSSSSLFGLAGALLACAACSKKTLAFEVRKRLSVMPISFVFQMILFDWILTQLHDPDIGRALVHLIGFITGLALGLVFAPRRLERFSLQSGLPFAC